MIKAIDATTLSNSQELDVIRSGALASLPSVQPTAPLRYSPISTIAPAPTEESFSKISLDMYREVEALSQEITKTTTEQLKIDQQQHEALAKQKRELIKQEIEARHSQENWDKVSNALEYVVYLSMLVTSQQVDSYAKYILQGVAALGLANRFGADTGLTESILNHFVKSKQTQEQIQTTLRVVAVTASLAALFATWNAPTFTGFPSLEALVRNMEEVSKGTSFAVGGSKIGQKWADRRRSHLQADLKQIDTSITLGSQEFQQRMQEAQQGNQSLKEATRSMKGILANAEIHPLED